MKMLYSRVGAKSRVSSINERAASYAVEVVRRPLCRASSAHRYDNVSRSGMSHMDLWKPWNTVASFHRRLPRLQEDYPVLIGYATHSIEWSKIPQPLFWNRPPVNVVNGGSGAKRWPKEVTSGSRERASGRPSPVIPK